MLSVVTITLSTIALTDCFRMSGCKGPPGHQQCTCDRVSGTVKPDPQNNKQETKNWKTKLENREMISSAPSVVKCEKGEWSRQSKDTCFGPEGWTKPEGNGV